MLTYITYVCKYIYTTTQTYTHIYTHIHLLYIFTHMCVCFIVHVLYTPYIYSLMTISLHLVSESACAQPVYQTPPSAGYIDLTSGHTISNTATCSNNDGFGDGVFTYYRILNNGSCNSMNILINNENIQDPSSQSVEVVVGKWPNIQPTYTDLVWMGYDNYNQSFTIDAWDPSFDGGNTCGSIGKDPCYYYLGVYAWCADPYLSNNAQISYSLTVTLEKQHKIYGVKQVGQSVKARGTNQYKFCVDDVKSAQALLYR